MKKRYIYTSLCCLAFTACVGQKQQVDLTNLKSITDTKKLMYITDTYRSDSDRLQDFIPQNDGTVIDTKTGLQWQQCSVGQTWENNSCKGELKQFSWDEISNVKSDLAGYSDWRLATIVEMETLVYCSSGEDEGRNDYLNWCKGKFEKPTINKEVFPNMQSPYVYWTYNRDNKDDYKYVLSFFDGHVYEENRKSPSRFPIRLVRNR